MRRAAKLLSGALLFTGAPAFSQEVPEGSRSEPLTLAAAEAQQQLRQTFTNLSFEDFGPAPVRGPLYQAIAGGRMIYFAPESGHLLFAAVYDKNGLNVTAMAQDASARKRIGAIDPAGALVIGPAGAPQVIEFTDPDCPYCHALDRFWEAKAAEGKTVQRLIYFVSGIHPEAGAKAEHILCSPDKVAAFKAIYAGAKPAALLTCATGRDKVIKDALTTKKMGVSGTPTLFVEGKLISGFQQAELEAFLAEKQGQSDGRP
ncbi:MAG: protein-disulfide isomerase [Alphaproteobacteria bacterium HGW-Alphaproteobacteria-16]|nr:MAG: protein-disulfide isomerase [Alphaproteobacteria bacterium HGW-Alphaproteobacteria-16]